ncbi:MAG TPA: o-succinylbenzoate--CoA ligase [Oligoflexia bacterium]|nr:o-succinylbenzoate--CoA ligase [Oligoflexia bacterium]
MSQTVLCPIAENYIANPDAISLRTENEVISFTKLEQQVRFLTRRFKELGVKKFDRVAILSENSPLIVPIIFAIYRLEASAIFLSLQLTPKDWEKQLEASKTRFITGQENYLTRLEVLPEVIYSFSAIKSEIEVAPQIDSVEPRDLVLDNESSIIFTSSKTGHKKGVILSIRNFVSSATASNKLTGLKSGDFWGVSLPLYHVGGLGIIFRTLFAGAGSNFLDSFSPKSILLGLSRGSLTHLSLVPTVLDELISEAEESGAETIEAIRSIKAVILAGAASSKSLMEKIIRLDLPVLSAWGMTETTAHCTCMSLEDPREKVATVGHPFYHTSIKLVDDDEKEVFDEGEILVKGPTVCTGYLDSSMPQPKMNDGWLYTGDIGSIDGDGYLSITGRKDDMFISGGENIHAAEIESLIKTYWKVKDVAVIPVSHQKWGQRPVMIVETNKDSKIEIDEIREFLSDKIAKIKIPDRVHNVTALPRTAIGKIDYKELKKSYSE